MKKFFDVTMALNGLLILSPVILTIALLIHLANKGPVLFKQKRVGINGKLFILYKFRSMQNMEFAEEGRFEPGNTTRVTSIGKFLRRTKLDELPQLFNVLKGDMSFVGPRPEVEKWVAEYPERWKKILRVKPGITDNASIVYKNEEFLLSKAVDPEKTYREIILPKKLDYYEAYALNHSFFGDLKLIIKTLYYILKNTK